MKNNTITLWLGTSVLFLAIAVTGRQELFGAILGYWLGFLNSAWLHRDTLRSVDLDVLKAIAKMRRSFFARLGVVTMFVVAVARWERDWLPDLASGIAAGLMVSLISYVRRQIINGKG